MLPLWPELIQIDAVPSGDVLGVAGFGTAFARANITISMPQLGPVALAEVWRSALPVTPGRHEDITFASNGSVLFGSVSAKGSDTAPMTAALYDRILNVVKDEGYPHLLRIWNHVAGINDDERDMERYKCFSAGRHEALTNRGYAREQFPAASAVGMQGKGIAVYFIASRQPAVQVENPRQVAAYDYPPVHGPRSPSFARATIAQWDSEALIFISGTASVVGHETKHEGDVVAQLDETMRNLERIVTEAATRAGKRGSLDDLMIAKTYIRRASDYSLIAPRLEAALPRAKHLFMESDICRKNLLLEIEGIAKVV